MSITSYVDCLKNTALKNPIAQAINEALDKLNEISIVGLTESAIATLTAMKDSLLEQAAAAKDWIVSLKDSLPLLKASDEMSNKMKIMKGILPSVNGGNLIKGITQGLDDLAQSALTFATDLKNTVSDAITGGVSAIEGMVTGLAEGVSGFANDLKAGLDGVTESIGGAISDLKDYAFAKFSALPQPPALSELMSKILPDVCQAPDPVEIKIEEEVAREVVQKKYEEAITPSTHIPKEPIELAPVEPATNEEDIPAPIVNNMSVEEIKAKVYEQIQTHTWSAQALRLDINPLVQKIADTVFTKYPDYGEVVEKSMAGDLTATRKRNAINAEMEQLPDQLALNKLEEEQEGHYAEVERLKGLLKEWALNNYENVPNGPPW